MTQNAMQCIILHMQDNGNAQAECLISAGAWRWKCGVTGSHLSLSMLMSVGNAWLLLFPVPSCPYALAPQA